MDNPIWTIPIGQSNWTMRSDSPFEQSNGTFQLDNPTGQSDWTIRLGQSNWTLDNPFGQIHLDNPIRQSHGTIRLDVPIWTMQSGRITLLNLSDYRISCMVCSTMPGTVCQRSTIPHASTFVGSSPQFPCKRAVCPASPAANASIPGFSKS